MVAVGLIISNKNDDSRIDNYTFFRASLRFTGFRYILGTCRPEVRGLLLPCWTTALLNLRSTREWPHAVSAPVLCKGLICWSMRESVWSVCGFSGIVWRYQLRALSFHLALHGTPLPTRGPLVSPLDGIASGDRELQPLHGAQPRWEPADGGPPVVWPQGCLGVGPVAWDGPRMARAGAQSESDLKISGLWRWDWKMDMTHGLGSESRVFGVHEKMVAVQTRIPLVFEFWWQRVECTLVQVAGNGSLELVALRRSFQIQLSNQAALPLWHVHVILYVCMNYACVYAFMLGVACMIYIHVMAYWPNW